MLYTPLRRYLAEMLGTFVLVFAGVGTAVLASTKVGNLGIAFGFGLSLLVMVYAIGPISGAHLNPAVTLGMLLSGRVNRRDALFYAVSQIIGAIAAAAVLLAVAKSQHGGYDLTAKGLGANGYAAHSPGHYALIGVIITELIATALLVFTVLAATHPGVSSAIAGIPIGLVLLLIHVVTIPVDGTSVNPARSIGPALIVGGSALDQLWVFIVVPLLGGALAAAGYRALYPTSPEPASAAASAKPAPAAASAGAVPAD